MHGQRLLVLEAVGIELNAVVEMARNDQGIALHLALTGLGEPVGLAALHEFDEAVLVWWQMALEGVALVR